ncbi:MAG: DNA repair protein RadA, partial [Ktedonobacterales bacterium]
MPKTHTKFVCQQCGYESAKWMGRCPDCGEWNALVETVITPTRAATSGTRGGAVLARGGEAVAIPLP